ncbi:uncharacterized protein PGTG_22021 [Puccinia graminis f. sp. tritici CRL 75-36-700-3]|uniref:Uncharacterized protein n=1 Tax=Puccinia graminis f. sp. tritici (strain CRL 75-36-700-3 / race SCCL) TaxID=418459 RepID=H6QTA9_PUCGT|nr:uncharacterized protein PGTG_22021 [Puccinia graminis f. sp. tritici CRL 75-36-700-3]EHS64063.1 hypothetical protein PGTG_22021 [Puccinia graminis f. sp. tritici CRL 75-36-700-3]
MKLTEWLRSNVELPLESFQFPQTSFINSIQNPSNSLRYQKQEENHIPGRKVESRTGQVQDQGSQRT